MGKTAYIMVNDRGCFRCRAVFARHDPSVRFRSCVLLSSEVFVDKGVFGVPTLILACHECCRGNRFYSMLLKMPRPSCVLPKNLLYFFGFCQVSPPFFRIFVSPASDRRLAKLAWRAGELLPTTLPALKHLCQHYSAPSP